MGLLSRAAKYYRDAYSDQHSHSPPTMAEVERAAAAAQLEKKSEIEVLQDLILTDDFEQLAFDDREAVRQYREDKLGIKHTPEQGITRRRTDQKNKGGPMSQLEDMGHIIGDVHINNQPKKTPAEAAAKLLIPLAITGLLGFIAWKLLDSGGDGGPNADKITNVVPGFGDPNAITD